METEIKKRYFMKQEPEVILVSESEVERNIISQHDKMIIETGNFFKGLCSGLDKPSKYSE